MAGKIWTIPVWLWTNISWTPAAKAKLPSKVKGRYLNFEYPRSYCSPFTWKELGRTKFSANIRNDLAAPSPSIALACILAIQLKEYPVHQSVPKLSKFCMELVIISRAAVPSDQSIVPRG